jgi:hypothetical protein
MIEETRLRLNAVGLTPDSAVGGFGCPCQVLGVKHWAPGGDVTRHGPHARAFHWFYLVLLKKIESPVRD